MVKNRIDGNTIRIAIGVENAVRSELEEFATKGRIGEDENKPFVFEVSSPEAMMEVLRWASLVSIRCSVKMNVGNDGGEVELPDPWI